MSELLVLEFSAPNVVELYQKVSRMLDVDPGTGTGDWPQPLESHVAGDSGDRLIVVEVWESKAVQETFMQSRLGPALQEANVPPPTRVEWFSLTGRMRR
jgi:hypothetical protein